MSKSSTKGAFGWMLQTNRTHGWTQTGEAIGGAFVLNGHGEEKDSLIRKYFYDYFNNLPQITIRETLLKCLKNRYNISDHHAKVIGDLFYIYREYVTYLLENIIHAMNGAPLPGSQYEFQDILNLFGMPEPEKITGFIFGLVDGNKRVIRTLSRNCNQQSSEIQKLKKEARDKTQNAFAKKWKHCVNSAPTIAELLLSFGYFNNQDIDIYRYKTGEYKTRIQTISRTIYTWEKGKVEVPDWYIPGFRDLPFTDARNRIKIASSAKKARREYKPR